MTENERVLRDIIIDGNGFDYDESIPQSIFEEIQQYRAIGTVEECEKAMDFELAKQDMLDCVDEVEIDYTLTNAGRIRSMSDEELAEFLQRFGTFNQPCSLSDGEPLKWLQSEAE